MISSRGEGIWREVHAPAYGQQDRGVAPGGAQDRFSWACARILLGDLPEIRTWECIYPPGLDVTEDCVGVMTGGDFVRVTAGGQRLQSGKVFCLQKGDRLVWEQRRMGFRTYLALRPMSSGALQRVGLERGLIENRRSWWGHPGILRIMRGPEADLLTSWPRFASSGWVTSLLSGADGLRLEGEAEVSGPLTGMISAPVVDGTLQKTPDGCILLLRERPTVGGYPRVGVVVDADVDLAAQLPPRRRIRFEEISRSQAGEILEAREAYLQRLRERCAAETPSQTTGTGLKVGR